MFIKLLISFLVLFVLLGCDTKKPLNLDGKKLLEQKCSSCHNLDLPPKTFADEIAPPMMAVAFHIMDFIEVSNDSEKVSKSVEFVKDYVVNPSKEKSFCDKESLKSYGLMPSQKGKVTQDELEAIAKYMFKHFNVKNLTEAQEMQNKLNAMPKGKRLALKHRCLGCHKRDKDLIAPSFNKIAKRYNFTTKEIQNSIKNGSVGHWKDYNGVRMPNFGSKIESNDIQTISKWIVKP